MAPKKTLLDRFCCRIAEVAEETVEQPTTLQPDAQEENVSVAAPEVQEDTGRRGASRVRGNPLVMKARSLMEIYIKDRDHMAFRECHKILMRNTPFSFYVDNTSGCAFCIRMLEDIISTHVGGNIFLLGKKEVLFTVQDVGIILGLPNCGHLVRHYGSTKKKSRLHERLGMTTNFDREKVHSLFQELVWFLEHTRPPMTNDDQAPPIGHFEEDITTAVEDVDAENPNSMVRAIKERKDRRPGLYNQSPYVREKPVTILEKEKAVATEEPVTAKWVCKGQLKEKHNAIVESFLETCGTVGSEPE
ncbi:hypothetical protein Taro_030658 [Colocasia esculenta]|uniref:Uncharacterized protein n=1 Tax=Colocasia esculenta TaxID=4460 RepID=A0A843W3Z7_COLES|nr:hypothetical protein [Colocasia esculenta]